MRSKRHIGRFDLKNFQFLYKKVPSIIFGNVGGIEVKSPCVKGKSRKICDVFPLSLSVMRSLAKVYKSQSGLSKQDHFLHKSM